MKLLDQQQKFLRLTNKLEQWAWEHGYELTEGDAFRDTRFSKEKIGEKSYFHDWSYHCKRLAKDYNLFKDDIWLQKTEDFRLMGEYWESLDPMCSWGGKWNDGNHFSYGEGKKGTV